MEFLSKSVEDTKKFAKDFLATVAPPASGGATVAGLYGNLGSGKTTFVQCVAKILGVKENLTSPTFLILKSYPLPPYTPHATPYTLLHHIDAYRLKSSEELRKLGFEELLTCPTNLILIEWADLVVDILPPDHLKLNFEFVDEVTRKISYS